MPCLIDVKFQALRDQGFTGSMSDMVLQWLQANGATSNAISDAWGEMLSIQVSTAGTNSDRWYALLKAEGFTGDQINDLEMAFWQAGGTITPLPMGGFSDGFSDGFEI